jgi:hypothetical protein
MVVMLGWLVLVLTCVALLVVTIQEVQREWQRTAAPPGESTGKGTSTMDQPGIVSPDTAGRMAP